MNISRAARREWPGLVEEARVSALTLDPVVFPNSAQLKTNAQIGRLGVTNSTGNTDGDGDFDQLYAFGARSFSIWTATVAQVFDSGDQIEQITAQAFPTFFNSTHDSNNSFDTRSDNKGPEPEGVVVAQLFGRTYAFIGLERIGGVMLYEITNPFSPKFVQYVNNRNFAGNPAAGTAGDLGPEGLLFIPASDSPSRRPLLVVTNEISGTTTIYEISQTP
jgi:2',3'-cyclic-nucleotide 2'-phosphodiesterase/3'-nucleotidase/5'-nucleotidase